MEAATIPTATLDRQTFEDLGALIGRRSLASLVALFSARAGMVDELVDASRCADGDELARLTHSLKGGASSLAAMRLAELAAELERRGRLRMLDDAEPLAEEAAAEFDRAIAAMYEALDSNAMDGSMTQGVRRTPAA